MAEVFETDSRAGAEGSSERRVARVYAEALLNVAQQSGQADEIGQELEGIVSKVFSVSPEIEKALASPVVRRSVKGPVLEHAFKGNVSDVLFGFLNVLNAKDRLMLIRPAAAAYRNLLDERAKRVRVTVKSAVPLSDEQTAKLKESILNATGFEPVIAVRVDENLLGGMIVQLGDKVFDSSVRTHRRDSKSIAGEEQL